MDLGVGGGDHSLSLGPFGFWALGFGALGVLGQGLTILGLAFSDQFNQGSNQLGWNYVGTSFWKINFLGPISILFL